MRYVIISAVRQFILDFHQAIDSRASKGEVLKIQVTSTNLRHLWRQHIR